MTEVRLVMNMTTGDSFSRMNLKRREAILCGENAFTRFLKTDLSADPQTEPQRVCRN